MGDFFKRIENTEDDNHSIGLIIEEKRFKIKCYDISEMLWQQVCKEP